ncbi:hypothetical protein PQ469_25610 [Mucilaginibacter sp. KACC 22773]|jgi:hypothetical protein|uniref:hypothetical protein n=1 Tax=Mucilaginibacter sp. KACC 22773 TaxID=3025671 RepID=UPI002365C29A|nr:hypothetical protein [Mucilaginibacter sp. KACC 22773]WDF77266.1 hypothetical protein PQ469_25610 [Mucilaginibacter sp. KACC 22773]
MDKRKKRDGILIVYHVFTMILLIYLYWSDDFKSGPCTPGAGVMMTLFSLLVLAVLLMLSIVKVILNRENKYFLFINLGVVIIWAAIFFAGSL